MAGLVMSSTMLGLLAFFELTGVCSWGLIGYYNDEKALKAATKAIITTEIASIGLFVATAYFFVVTGGFRLAALANLDDTSKILIFAGILIAAWGKSAQLPFHFWLPDAMAAPTPISAYLHAASMVNAGVYILARCLLAAVHVPDHHWNGRQHHGDPDHAVWPADVFPSEGFQEAAGLFHDRTAFLHLHGAVAFRVWFCDGLQRGGGPYFQPCLRQGPLLPGGRCSRFFHRHANVALA